MNQDPAILFNRANGAFRKGSPAEALVDLDAALALAPELEPALVLRARCLVQTGELMAAREAFARLLRSYPANYSGWLEAGHLCRQMGEMQQALGAYRRAIEVAPQRYEAFLAQGRVLEQVREFSHADDSYRQALELATQQGKEACLQVCRLMGSYRLEYGDGAHALSSLQAGLQSAERVGGSNDELAEIRIDLGEALLRLGRNAEAHAVLGLASSATKEETLNRLMEVSYRYNLWQEALEVGRRNVEQHPESLTARWNLAHLLAECWQMEEAEQMLAGAEALGPVPGARSLRARVAGSTGDVDRALELYLELAREENGVNLYGSSVAMSSLYSDKLSPAEVATLHRDLFVRLGNGARTRESFVRAPLAGRRLRVGLVSADFHGQHPVNIFMQPILRELDREKIELFVYFTGVSHDAQTGLARTRVEHWQQVPTFNDTQLAKRIDEDGIDLLLDLGGHTNLQRMGLFARRVAPVQATYLGYPGSTGVPNMDWIIGDDVVTPPGCEEFYSEQIARLPGVVFCYAPEERYPYPDYTRTHAGRPLTFGSFNNVPKLTEHTLRLWARVLNAVPDSRLLLKAPSFMDAGAVDLFRRRLEKLGVDGARVEFRGPVGLADMMAEYADLDIALDPVPYNGGTTSLQALWMGVPVICKRGQHFVSRMGASFMTAAGLPDWVADDDDGYVEIACRQAADREGLLALKRGLRERLLSRPGWDVVAHTRAFEDLLLEIAMSV
jgi:predicted O-linked N-acetylglucosamine transferase (SPINDLY family)